MQQPMPVQPKSSNKLGWLLVGCLVPVLLILCCVVGGFLVYLLSPSTIEPVLALLGLATKAQAAAYAPAQSPIFMAMDIDLTQVVNAQRIFGIYQKNTQAQSSMTDFKTQFKTSTGCDFDTDIASWWGPDAALFFTDNANLSASTATSSSATELRTVTPRPNMVIAVATRDVAKSQTAIQKCRTSTSQAPSTEETYKGNKITNYDSVSVAVVGKYLLLATTPTAMHAAIDASRGDVKSLSQDANYTKAVAGLMPSRVATVYVQIAPLVAAMQQTSTGIQPQTLAQFDAYQYAAASLSFETNGIRMDAIGAFDPTKLPDCTKQLLQQAGVPNQSLKAAPADSIAFISGNNIKGVWDCTLAQLDPTSQKQMQDSFTSLNNQMGIDLSADVLSWLTGEYALVITNAKPISSGLPGVGMYALIEAKDQNLVNTKMTKIAGAIGKQGLAFKDQTIKGVAMKTVTLGASNDPTAPAIGYGMLGNFLVIGGPTDALNAAVDASKNPLASDSTFQAVQKVLPAKNNGYFYSNMSGIDKLISGALSGTQLTNYQQDMQPWLKPIKAVGSATAVGTTNSTSGTLFIYIPGE